MIKSIKNYLRQGVKGTLIYKTFQKEICCVNSFKPFHKQKIYRHLLMDQELRETRNLIDFYS